MRANREIPQDIQREAENMMKQKLFLHRKGDILV
jgi:hypothetical protein